MNNYPKFRDVHPIPHVQNGKNAFMLRDPLQLNKHMLIIPEAIAPLVYIADGTKDISVLSKILDYHYGVKVGESELTDIFNVFDEAFLLENARSNVAYQASLDVYRSKDYRLPSSAGASYPSDPDELSHLLQDYLDEAEVNPSESSTKGILSPHIDFARGGKTYASVWKRASATLANVDLIVVIGTDHNGTNNAITLTRQNYATPFGILPTDQEIVDSLASVLGEDDAFKGELFHQNEHSIELPLVWLHHLLGAREVPVVPILCGTLDPKNAAFQEFIKALQEATKNRNTFVVISGDLAHIGPAFGGDPIDEEGLQSISEIDQKLLAILEKVESETFLKEILDIDNANNVCGTFPLYLGLKTFQFNEGEINGYEQCLADEEGTSFVSVGGMVFR